MMFNAHKPLHMFIDVRDNLISAWSHFSCCDVNSVLEVDKAQTESLKITQFLAKLIFKRNRKAKNKKESKTTQ